MTAPVGSGQGARVAVVTGASSGVGKSIALAFGALGWSVALGARRVERLEETARAVESAGGRAFACALDVTDEDSIERFFRATEAAFGPPDLLVNNAGIGIPGRLQDVAVADLRREIATDLLGPMLVTRRALARMIERRLGDVVFVSSMNAVAPRPFQAGYTAAKAGLEGLAAALRMDLEGTGVRVIVLRLGPTLSDFGLAWDSSLLIHVVETWQRWGLIRHNEMLEPDRAAAVVVAAVTAPRGMQLDVVQVNPEAPVGE